jgi:hypothetical protein
MTVTLKDVAFVCLTDIVLLPPGGMSIMFPGRPGWTCTWHTITDWLGFLNSKDACLTPSVLTSYPRKLITGFGLLFEQPTTNVAIRAATSVICDVQDFICLS